MKTCRVLPVITGLLLVFMMTCPVSAADAPGIEWQKVLGSSADDFAYSINQTDDGGYIIVGTTRSVGSGGGSYSYENQDILVMKLDSAGNLQWQKVYGEYAEDGASGIQQTTDGGYILVGYTGASRYRDVLVLKLDPAGNLQWQKVLGGNAEDSGSDIQQTADGGYVLIGRTESSNSGDVGPNHGYGDIWVVRLSPSGSLQWQRLFGGSGDERGNSIRQTTDGGYILTGDTESSNSGNVGSNHGPPDVWVAKLDTGGNLEWQKVLGGSARDTGSSIRQTGDGGYILTGVTASGNSGDVGPGYNSPDFWVVKLDSSGNIDWQKVLGGTGVDFGKAIEQTTDGGYILTGYSTSANSGDVGPNHDSCDAWVVKLDPSGIIQWQRQFGGSEVEWGMDIQQTSDGGYVFTGNTLSSNSGDVGQNHGRNDFWVVKLFPDTQPLFPTLVTATTPIPSVGQATSSYQVGFDGLSYNADGKSTLDLDLAKARRSLATVSVYTDRVEIYQRAPDGVLVTFRGTDFAVKGDRVTGPVKSAYLITDPVQAPLTPGIVSGSVRATIPELTRQGTIKTTIDDRPGPSLIDQFRSFLVQNGLEYGMIAYIYDIRKSNMPRIGSALVNLTLPESWVNQQGGISMIRIIRVSDTTGALELLPVTYAGTDKKGIMHFEGISVNGTSVFGLVTLKATKMAQEKDPGLSIVPMQQPAILTMVGIFSWLLGSLQQNPGGIIAIVVTACAAYAGRRRGMW
jgi:hypothetical protein